MFAGSVSTQIEEHHACPHTSEIAQTLQMQSRRHIGLYQMLCPRGPISHKIPRSNLGTPNKRWNNTENKIDPLRASLHNFVVLLLNYKGPRSKCLKARQTYIYIYICITSIRPSKYHVKHQSDANNNWNALQQRSSQPYFCRCGHRGTPISVKPGTAAPPFLIRVKPLTRTYLQQFNHVCFVDFMVDNLNKNI